MDGQADQLANNGWALYRGGNARGALREFLAALAINPDHRNALVGVTQVHIAFNELAKANEAADHLLKLEPNLSQAHRIKGEVMRRSRRLSQAESHLKEAIRLDPNDPLGYHFLGIIDLDRKRYDRALRTTLNGRKVAPWYGVLAAQQAYILLHTKGAKTAEPFADEGLRLSPDERYVMTIAARVAFMRGKLQKARDLLEVALQRDANDEEAISLYLLTDPKKYRLLRANVRSQNWRRERGGLLGGTVYALGWCAALTVIGIIGIVGHVPVIVASLAYSLFWRAQYAGHRKQVRQHFAQPALKPGY